MYNQDREAVHTNQRRKRVRADDLPPIRLSTMIKI
nr:MAG TPA: hypothetical protein [Caudoviricetes sp.]